MREKIFLVIFMLFLSMAIMPAIAHSGRTDSSGGHHDYNNVSGLGDYHYHHGYPAHLHENGTCPYIFDDETSSGTNSSNNSAGSHSTTNESTNTNNSSSTFSKSNAGISEDMISVLGYLCIAAIATILIFGIRMLILKKFLKGSKETTTINDFEESNFKNSCQENDFSQGKVCLTVNLDEDFGLQEPFNEKMYGELELYSGMLSSKTELYRELAFNTCVNTFLHLDDRVFRKYIQLRINTLILSAFLFLVKTDLKNINYSACIGYLNTIDDVIVHYLHFPSTKSKAMISEKFQLYGLAVKYNHLSAGKLQKLFFEESLNYSLYQEFPASDELGHIEPQIAMFIYNFNRIFQDDIQKVRNAYQTE